jgi:hypothetical protein
MASISTSKGYTAMNATDSKYNQEKRDSSAFSFISEEILKLANLKAQGIISEEEFETTKKKIIVNYIEKKALPPKIKTKKAVSIVLLILVISFGLGALFIVYKPMSFAANEQQPQVTTEDTAKDVLRSLKSIASVTDAGVTLSQYSDRVLDTKVKVDVFLSNYPENKISPYVKTATNAYIEARKAWEEMIKARSSRTHMYRNIGERAKTDTETKNTMEDCYIYSAKNFFTTELDANKEINEFWKCANNNIKSIDGLLEIEQKK